jgi:hypothetical protein
MIHMKSDGIGLLLYMQRPSVNVKIHNQVNYNISDNKAPVRHIDQLKRYQED